MSARLPILATTAVGSPIAAEAVALAARGWALLPVRPGGKEPYAPLLPVGPDGPTWTPLARRPASPTAVAQWFRVEPRLNIAVVPGPSGLVVLDVDHPARWPRGWSHPPTPIQTTPGAADGPRLRWHAVFRAPARRWTPRRQWPWGEVLAGDACYVVVLGADAAGRPYTWLPGLSPAETPVVPLPEALRRKLERGAGVERPRGPGRPGPKNIYVLGTPPRGSPGARSPEVTPPAAPAVAALRHAEAALAVLQHFQVPVSRVGTAFRCPFHPERRPSVALWQARPGAPLFWHEFHPRAPQAWWGLPEVVYALWTGTPLRRLPHGSGIAGWARAAVAAGVLVAPAIAHAPLPATMPAGARRLFEGFVELLVARGLYAATEAAAAPFSWRFALDWCGPGLTERLVRDGWTWLQQAGWVQAVGHTGRLTLYGLGPAARSQ